MAVGLLVKLLNGPLVSALVKPVLENSPTYPLL